MVEAVAEPAVQTAFEYGWCETDHKDGKKIRTAWRKTDYMQDEPYASSVKDMLERLGLPQPQIEQVFRGTHHDLLFIDSHGVVVRIGPTDVEDLIHPAILQPLGWLDDKENGFSVTIYPGIELYNDFLSREPGNDLLSGMQNIMTQTGQGIGDAAAYNTGVIRLRFGDGPEVPLALLLDPDNEYNSSNANSEADNAKKSILSSSQASSVLKSTAVQNALNSVSSFAIDAGNWKKAFQIHQPLRNLFWLACEKTDAPDGTPDAEYMQDFWDRCAAVTNKPERVVDPDTGDVFDMGLSSPWTGKDEDRRPKKAVLTTEEQALEDRRVALEDVIQNPVHWTELSEEFKNNLEFVKDALKGNIAIARHLPEDLLLDDTIQDIICEKIADNTEMYRKLPLSLRKNYSFALKILGKNADPSMTLPKTLLRYFPKTLQRDREFNLDAIKTDISVFHDLLPEYRDDKEIASFAIKRHAGNLQYASERLKNDKDFILSLIEERPGVSGQMKPALYEDPTFMLEAIKRNGKVLGMFRGSLRETSDFIMQAAQLDNVSFYDLPSEYKEDHDFIAELVEKRPDFKELPEVRKLLKLNLEVNPGNLQEAFQNRLGNIKHALGLSRQFNEAAADAESEPVAIVHDQSQPAINKP